MDIVKDEVIVRGSLIHNLRETFLAKTRDAYALVPPPVLDFESYLEDVVLANLFDTNQARAQNSALLLEIILRCKDLNNHLLDQDKDIEKIKEEFKDLSTEVKDLKEQVSKLEDIVEKLNRLFTRFNNLYERLEQIVENLGGALDEIKDKIEKILTEIKLINDRLSALSDDIDNYFDRKWEGFLNNFLDAANQWWDSFKENQLPGLSEDYWRTFKNKLDEWWDEFKRSQLPSLANNYWRTFKSKLDAWWEVRKKDIIGENLLYTLTNVGLSVDGVAVEIAKIGAELDAQTKTIVGEVAGVGFLVGLVEVTVKRIDRNVRFIESVLKGYNSTLKNYLDEKFKKPIINIEQALTKYQKDNYESIVQLVADGVRKVIKAADDIQKTHTVLLDSNLKEISKTISNEVAAKIVGESWAKWDSVTSFYPTLVFIMKEDSDQEPSRRAQIKLRYYKTSDEITDLDIGILKTKAALLKGFSYNYGTLRVNFVSKDKKIKTTLYVSTKEEAVKVLNKFADLANFRWGEEDLTITQGPRRDSITRRTTPLDGINTFVDNYNSTFVVKMFRVSLLINGLERPIRLFDEE